MWVKQKFFKLNKIQKNKKIIFFILSKVQVITIKIENQTYQ